LTPTSERAGAERSSGLVQLRNLIEQHAARGQETAIDGVLVASASKAEDPQGAMSGTVFALIAQGVKRISHGDRVMEYGPGQYLVASLDLPITGHYTRASRQEPALGFGLLLRPASIADLIVQEGVDRWGGRAHDSAPPGLGVAEAGADLIDAAVRMLQLLDSPADIPVLAPMIEREILWRLMNGPLAGTVRQAGLADSSLSQIGTAVRWINDHYGESFRIDELAELVAMSPSAFHRNFKAVTALSPIQFQKQIRLQRARLLLVNDSADVSTVAHAVGYDSSTQFNREYKRQFGRPPGRDAVALRAGARGDR